MVGLQLSGAVLMIQDGKAPLAAIAGHRVIPPQHQLQKPNCMQLNISPLQDNRDDRDGVLQEDMRDKAHRAKSASRVCAHVGVIPLHPTVPLWIINGLNALDCREEDSAGKTRQRAML